MARERSKTIMLAPGGHGPPRIYGKGLSKEVASLFFSNFESHESDMRSGGLKESPTHAEVYIRQLLDAEQRNTLASLYFSRGRSLSEREVEKRLELMVE